MRTPLVLVTALGLMLAVSGCTASTTPKPDATGAAADCTPAPAGAASDGVAVSGKVGAKPTVTVTAPITAPKGTQRTVITKGGGDLVLPGSVANVEFTLLNGTTGDALSDSGYTGRTVSFTMDEAKFLPGVVKTLECTSVGSRVVGVIPPSDSFGDAGSEANGIKPGDSIVFVADVVSISPPALERAEGEPQAPTPGLPAVTLDASGAPTVTIPDGAAPKELQLGVLIKGTGAKIGENANVVVNYQGTNWRTKEIFDSSWAGGTPATFNTGGVVAGFKQAIEGQTVGSQVVVVIPPELGYGSAGNEGAGIKGTDTLVFVIDILGIA